MNYKKSCAAARLVQYQDFMYFGLSGYFFVDKVSIREFISLFKFWMIFASLKETEVTCGNWRFFWILLEYFIYSTFLRVMAY